MEKRNSISLSLIVYLLLCVVPAFGESLPKLSIPSPQYDFGAVSQGQKVSHDFEIKNIGAAPLQIQRLVPSCGCTATSIDANTIEPGGTGTVKVEFDTSGFSGEKVKSVRLYTNDDSQSIAMVSLKGKIEQDVFVEPQRVYLGKVIRGAEGETQQARVVVKTREGSNVKITGVKTYAKSIELKELESDASKRVFAVSLKPDAPLGELRERIVVSLSGSKRSSINVPIYASVQGQLKLKPNTLFLGVLKGDESALERSVKLENLGPDPIKVTSIESNSPAVTAQMSEIKPGKIYVIKVAVDPNLLKNDLRAAVTIKTDHKEEKQLSLNIYGVQAPRV